MVRVIYGDVLLLVDFCMNCFALYITAYLIRRHVKTLCLVGAALVGGIYNVAAVYLNTDNLLAKLTAAAVGLLMCYIAFGGYHFVRTALTFFAVSALIGGLMLRVCCSCSAVYRTRSVRQYPRLCVPARIPALDVRGACRRQFYPCGDLFTPRARRHRPPQSCPSPYDVCKRVQSAASAAQTAAISSASR